ncbi:MAG TPA: hypothetical protein VMC08_00235 [Bacteroidales bacterium]|nr:hypothetical protein [Bacteroidales bacterium]
MKIRTILLFGIIFMAGCTQQKGPLPVYRYYWGKKDGYNVWVVDGYLVRQKIYNEFLYGGNEQRYPFTPKGEIWIDHAISAEEFDLTLMHELNERHLMAKYGWSYDTAHDSSLRLEVLLRRKWEKICRAHEDSLAKVSVRDRDGIKEIKDIPDSIRLENIYRIPEGSVEGIAIWVVDGYRVRAKIFPDFGLSGNDQEYHFIPPREIWLDGQVSCEEMKYSVATELLERKLLLKGFSYGASYDSAINENTRSREAMEQLIRKHPPYYIPDTITREKGVIDPKEK